MEDSLRYVFILVNSITEAVTVVIKEVWSLRYEGKIMGVRVLTVNNTYYDIDIDVYKNRLKLDPSSLKSLLLMEYGDLFMTEEEFDTGVLVEDGSSNARLLDEVNTFVRSKDKTDPLAIAKRRKKVQEIRQKYYTYLPNRWLPEFADYHVDNFDGNENIYSTLNDPQIKLIKEYMRWRSKLIFDELKASKVLRTKLDKAKELVALMGNAKDWQYDGTVDTGYKGGSHCELGHALRYEHYAFSPSLNKQIIFGATCMSDFFEVDEAVLRNITQAQELLLKEVKSIVFIMQTGKFEEYMADYKDLWDVLKYFKGQFSTKIVNGSGWSYFLGGFAKGRLPLTRSMMQMYKKLYWQWQEEKDKPEDEKLPAPSVRNDANTEPVQESTPQPPVDAKWKEVLAQFDAIEEAASEGRVPKNHFSLTIIPTMRKTGWMSDKQKKYIDDALENMLDEQPF